MKNFLFLALLSIGLFSSCKDDDQNLNVLPEATQSGKNTAGALVNGKIWVASTNFISPPNGTFCEKINNITYIQLDLNSASENSRIFLKVAIENFEINKEYLISENIDTSDYNYATYSKDNNGYGTYPNSIYIGKITITKLNLLQDQMVCGIFEIKVKDNNENVINISDGRFDKKFD